MAWRQTFLNWANSNDRECRLPSSGGMIAVLASGTTGGFSAARAGTFSFAGNDATSLTEGLIVVAQPDNATSPDARIAGNGKRLFNMEKPQA